MEEKPDELKKLVAVSTDLELASELRIRAAKLITNVGTHDALLALLSLVANEKLTKKERMFANAQARELIRQVP